jgi:hypothetical protein
LQRMQYMQQVTGAGASIRNNCFNLFNGNCQVGWAHGLSS